MDKDNKADRLTLTVEEAGQLLGISRASAFALAGKPNGIPVIRLGRRLVVPRAALEKMLQGATCPPVVL